MTFDEYTPEDEAAHLVVVDNMAEAAEFKREFPEVEPDDGIGPEPDCDVADNQPATTLEVV